MPLFFYFFWWFENFILGLRKMVPYNLSPLAFFLVDTPLSFFVSVYHCHSFVIHCSELLCKKEYRFCCARVFIFSLKIFNHEKG